MLLSFGASTEEAHFTPEYEELNHNSGLGIRRSTASYYDEKHSTSDNNPNLSRCCCCRRSNFRLTLYVIMFTAFLCVGAVCFMTMEGDMLAKEMERFQKKREAFLAEHDCVSDFELEKFIKVVERGTTHGLSVLENATLSIPNWSFGQAVFYATTLVTTIGYGRITPISGFGKLFSIFYAMVGIPLAMILFTALIERLYIPSKRLLDWMAYKMDCCFSFLQIRMFHLSIVSTITAGTFFFLPATIFYVIEPGWGYLDAFYYCFISLTTIGLGDYVPGDQPNFTLRPLYKLLTVAYLFIGITFVILNLRVFHEITELNGGTLLSLASDEPMEMRRSRGPSTSLSTQRCYGSAAQLGNAQSNEDQEGEKRSLLYPNGPRVGITGKRYTTEEVASNSLLTVEREQSPNHYGINQD